MSGPALSLITTPDANAGEITGTLNALISQINAVISTGGGGINQLTGDVTAGPGTGSQASTLATVNSNVGSFTNASVTVNAKGLVTAASSGGWTGTTTAVAGAATLNKLAGIVTSEGLTSATTYTLTLTNSTITTNSVVLVTATDSANALVTIKSITVSSTQVVIAVSMPSLTGTVIFNYAVFN